MILTKALIPILLAGAAIQPASTSSTERAEPLGAHIAPDTWTPSTLLARLAENEASTDTLRGEVRFTTIKAIESDLIQRTGTLYIRRVEREGVDPHREYAVIFNRMILDNRATDVREHFVFDGRWFVERLYEERQFNKREIVPMGEELDPMALMSEAPYWVSLGTNADQLMRDYDLSIDDPEAYLTSNSDIPELAYLAQLVDDHVLLIMTPKPGSEHEDDWESVRLWFHPVTLEPRLSIKTEWSGDTQVLELFKTEKGVELEPAIFDTRTPPPESGWRAQVAPWRGDASHAGANP